MKPIHEKLPKDALALGRTYVVTMAGTPLYEAEIVKFSGGCWATVRVTRAMLESASVSYTTNAEFDIKVAQYEFQES